MKHGSYRYGQGCRCEYCRSSHAADARKYRALYKDQTRAAVRVHHKGRDKKAVREYDKRYYHKRRNRAIAFLGGVCVRCGTVENLQFDHVDPASKEVKLNYAFNSWSWNRIEPELLKCQLLCAEHHVEKTQQDRLKKSGTLSA